MTLCVVCMTFPFCFSDASSVFGFGRVRTIVSASGPLYLYSLPSYIAENVIVTFLPAASTRSNVAKSKYQSVPAPKSEMRAEIDNDAGKTIQRPWATFLSSRDRAFEVRAKLSWDAAAEYTPCLLYTSPSPR